MRRIPFCLLFLLTTLAFPAWAQPDTLLADPRVARWFVVEVFHLLGFRKESRRGALLAFSRRRSRADNSGL